MIQTSDRQDTEVQVVLAEYKALRDEVLKRVEMRHHLLSYTLLAAATFLSVGSQEKVTPMIPLIFPVLAVFLAAAWTLNDLRVGELGYYVRTTIENRLGGFGWEAHIFTEYDGGLNPLPRALVAWSAAGVFLTTELLAVFLALYRSNWHICGLSVVLLALDMVALLGTVLLVFARRHKYRGLRQGKPG